jgi:hypothetical protein
MKPLSRATLVRGWQELRIAVMYFSALHFSAASFFKESLPPDDVVPLTPHLRFYAIGAQILLCLVLYAAEALLARRGDGRARLAFRVSILSVCLVLIVGRIEPHVVPMRFALLLASVVHPGMQLVLSLLVAAAIVLLTARFHRAVTSGLVYLSTAAVVLTAVWFVDDLAPDGVYDQYDTSEVRRSSSSTPPVIVIVFDELAFETLLDADGGIDETRYPNFARLGRESLAFSNATSNYFDTWVVLPTMIDAAISLAPDRDVVLYEQTARIERVYAPGCGEAYTCRGAGYVTDGRSGELSVQIGVRAAHVAIPADLRSVLDPPLAWLRRATGVPAAGDPIYLHMNSNHMLDQFRADIRAGDTAGKVLFVHTLLPHGPYIFASDGPVDRDEWIQFHWDSNPDAAMAQHILQTYDEQLRYADNALADVIATLEDNGLYDDATLLVTADHGVRVAGPVDGVFDPAVSSLSTHVPLFIRAPSLAAAWTDVDYQHIDFAATLEELAGVAPRPFPPAASHVALDGARPLSALAATRPTRPKTFFVHGNGTRFWQFEQDPSTSSWDFLDVVEGATGDRTAGGD